MSEAANRIVFPSNIVREPHCVVLLADVIVGMIPVQHFGALHKDVLKV
jgi:uncharacterized membrane protein (DUF106 family)